MKNFPLFLPPNQTQPQYYIKLDQWLKKHKKVCIHGLKKNLGKTKRRNIILSYEI